MTALRHPLIGRETEKALLSERAAWAREGRGAIVLLRGEAGSGKTALARQVVAEAGLDRLDGFGGARDPLQDVVRAARAACQPTSPAPDDPAAIAAILAAGGPVAVVLDDLHLAPAPALEPLPALARALETAPVLLLLLYRDDEPAPALPALRSALRRDHRLEELAIGPLDLDGTAALLTDLHGTPPTADQRDAIHAFTAGIPFHVAEVADPRRVPEAVRDALLARAATLPGDVRALIGAAAVAGTTFDPDLVRDVAGAPRWPDDDAIPRGILALDGDRGAFRSPLIRQAFYEDVGRDQRAALHAAFAERLDDPLSTAEHLLAAGRRDDAGRAFLAAAEASCATHAYRDGMAAAHQALALAANNTNNADRLAALHRLATCAELAGDPDQAIDAWRTLSDHHIAHQDHHLAADTLRRLAAVLELEARWDQAIDARERAAHAFAQAHQPAEATAEWIAAAAHLRSAASFTAALRALQHATDQIDQTTGRDDLRLRIQALEGNVRARTGDADHGIQLVRDALAGALDRNLTTLAAEVYQRLADSLEHRGDYAAARATYDDAFAFCTNNGVEPAAQLCLACLSVVLRQAGDWERSAALATDVLHAPTSTIHARAAGGCTLGMIQALRGDADKARANLLDAVSNARAIELTAAEILSVWGLALTAQLGDDATSATTTADACRTLLARWRQSEDRHYGIAPLRWATTALIEAGDPDSARACAAALAQIAADAGQPEAMSALAHALGETALLDQDPQQAVTHFERAIALLSDVGSPPLERIESERRAAHALLQLPGRRDDAVERLLTAYHLARRLRMRPSIARLATTLADLGEDVERRLSRRQAEQLAHEQLTRRELQVLQHLAAGATNREIAAELVLSVRTVDTHVANVLRKMDCRSRADAARRASELGLLTQAR